MEGLTHIRKNVLKLTQAEVAAIAGVTQATVSRWERGELSPNLDEVGRIRAEVKRRRLRWDERLIWPKPTAPAPSPEEMRP